MWKIKTIGFFIFSCLSLVFSFASSSSVSAVSDLSGSGSIDLSLGSYNSVTVCTTDCSDYNYLILRFSNVSSLSNNPYVTISGRRFAGQTVFNQNVFLFYPLFIIDISSLPTLSNFYKLDLFTGVSGSSSLSFDYSWTLTENYSSCLEPDEPEPCPTIPDNPYDAKFDQVTRAIYTCGAILLVLYFFYCIYRIIIKNGGSR